MTNKEQHRKTLIHLLWLPGFMLIAAAIVALSTLYYKLNPSSSVEGAGWGAIGDGLSVLSISIVTFAIGLIWWTTRVVVDIVRHYQIKRFVWMNVMLLLFAYSPAIVYLAIEVVQSIKDYQHRTAITTNIHAYETINCAGDTVIAAAEMRGDSTLIYLYRNKRSEHNQNEKAFRFSNADEGVINGFQNKLHLAMLINKQLIAADNSLMHIDSSAHTAAHTVQIIDHKTGLWCTSRNEKKKIMIYDLNDFAYRDSIEGYHAEDRHNSIHQQVNTLSPDGTRWFIFYTDSKRTDPNAIFVARIKNHKSHVYAINLNGDDRTLFDSHNLLSLLVRQNDVLLVSRKKIMLVPITSIP
jgi:hypothetical protein